MSDGLVLFASAIGTMSDGPVLFNPAALFDPPVLIERPVFINRSFLIDRSVFIDRPAFIQVLWSGLDLDYRGLDLESAFDRGAIARTGPGPTGPTLLGYSADDDGRARPIRFRPLSLPD